MGKETVTLYEAWSKETSSDPENWTPDNPALGQCAVSALIIQDILGGDLLWMKINGESHYWNRLPIGTQVDLTIQQFGDIWARGQVVVKKRDYVLAFPETAKRYELLRKKLKF